jgi:hypothetical protein
MLGMFLSVVLCKKEIFWPSKMGVGHEAGTLSLLTLLLQNPSNFGGQDLKVG